MKRRVGIIGAGPAGLGAGYELVNSKDNKNLDITIFDKNDVVGGLARSYKFKGHFFDIGPHRFFTKNKEVLNFWKKVLGKDLTYIPRLTRIHYRNKIFYYPIQLKDVVLKLGLITDAQIFLSYLKSKIFLRDKKVVSFEQSITKDFGEKLYLIFFKTYSEKVWGITCDKISAVWAAQRIKNLNLLQVLQTAIFGQKFNKTKSMIDKFYYTTGGAGLLYTKTADLIKRKNGKILNNTDVFKVNHKNNKVISLEYIQNKKEKNIEIDYLFSSMPLTKFIFALSPKPPKKIIDAAKKLLYREHITVNLLIDKKNIFPDNWIYVHSPEVLMARVANYNNFYKQKKTQSAISVEYFTFQDEKIWKLTDDQLIKLAIKELMQINLLESEDLVLGSFVVREIDSYPAYYMGHEKYFEQIKKYVEGFGNVQLIGRGGMYKYNNMDHATFSGMLAARNFLLGGKKFDVWAINEDAEYLEEIKNK